MKLYSTKEAARYLKLTESGLKYHIYEGHIKPQKVGHSLVFTQEQLDEFNEARRPQGRPRKEPES